MRIKQIKKVEILSSEFQVIYNKTHNGGKFSLNNSTIEIGIKSIKQDPLYTHSIISHEIMEIILETLGARFMNGRSDDYLFSFNHQTFENAIQLHSQAMAKFLF